MTIEEMLKFIREKCWTSSGEVFININNFEHFIKEMDVDKLGHLIIYIDKTIPVDLEKIIADNIENPGRYDCMTKTLRLSNKGKVVGWEKRIRCDETGKLILIRCHGKEYPHPDKLWHRCQDSLFYIEHDQVDEILMKGKNDE